MDGREDDGGCTGRAPLRHWLARGGEGRALIARTAMVLWAPAMLPLFVTPLAESQYSVRMFVGLLPILPGVFVATVLRLDDGAWIAGALCATVLTFALVAVLLHRAGERWRWVAAGVLVLEGLQAVGFASALRM